MNRFPATLLCDFYKISHREQYPDKTQFVYSTWTPRGNTHHLSTDKVIAFGFQAFIKEYLIDYFNENFFYRELDDVLDEYEMYIKYTLGVENPDSSHIEKLWKLEYLPIKIKALPEGMAVPIRVPMLTIENTHPDFFWLTNYFETLMSCELWMPSTSATISKEYRSILEKYAKLTGADPDLIQFQAHDFSMRGCVGLEAAKLVGSGHLTSFTGTDNIPAIGFMEYYYNADISEELVGCSIPATEHSVMCAGGKEDEYKTYERLITKIYPTGMISIVSDTWDLWNTLTNIIPKLKDKILARDGKVVIRPDSGDPVDIICGLNTKHVDTSTPNVFDDNQTPEDKGVIELLWDVFGGTVNEKGYKVLDPHIGAIYGDAITLQRAEAILERLKYKGFSSDNIVFGVGSYTYQYNTRDTFGFALKSTACIIDDKEYKIFKDPVTDSGTKKSQYGKVAVVEIDSKLQYVDGLSWNEVVQGDKLQEIFKDGELLVNVSLHEIRERISKY